MSRRMVAVWVSTIILLSLIIMENAPRVEAPLIAIVIFVDDDAPNDPGPNNPLVSDPNEDGSPMHPFDMIQEGIDTASDGDTVIVLSGTYYENILINKQINLTGEDMDSTTIDAGGSGDVVHINANWVNITGFTIFDGGPITQDDHHGIRVENGQNCIISANKITQSCEGISLSSSSNRNTISNNLIRFNDAIGIYMDIYVSNTTIINNDISNNYHGIWVFQTLGNIISNNSFYSCHDAGIYLCEGSYNTISNNSYGYSSHHGIYLSSNSNSNIIIYNSFVSNSDCGIKIASSHHNVIHHNNFIENNNQAFDDQSDNYWDNGYPSGGNYWSDYKGNDSYKGPNQDVQGKDGIGDTNYSIDKNSIDNYPLMGLSPYFPTKNYTLLIPGWNLLSVPLVQNQNNLSIVLGSIYGSYDAVQRYNNSDLNDPWKHYRPEKAFGNDLSTLNESMGFWIHINKSAATAFLYNGTEPSSNRSIFLYPGWNMVGFPSLSNRERAIALNNLIFDIHVDAIWTFDASTQKWREIGASDSFELGRGYWIHATQECIWEVPL
jgi:parallel beta-helix repeat protein